MVYGMPAKRLVEKLTITDADGGQADLVADATVVQYTGRLYIWHGPMVFAAICKCTHCTEKGMWALARGEASPEPRLCLAEYAGGRTAIHHVKPYHVRLLDPAEHPELLGHDPEGTS